MHMIGQIGSGGQEFDVQDWILSTDWIGFDDQGLKEKVWINRIKFIGQDWIDRIELIGLDG